MLLLGTKGIRVIMSYTLRVMILLGYQPNSMRSKLDSTLQRRPKQTSIAIENSSIDWGFLLTGVGSFAPQTLPIIAGHSGFLCSFLMLGMIPKKIKPDPLMSSSITSLRMVPKTFQRIATKTPLHSLLINGHPCQKTNNKPIYCIIA